ncbi:MAG: ABC transporter permease [Desulfobacterales bacterium]|jgi:peptide/nickel transport system permease protein
MDELNYIIKRVLQIIPVLLIITILIFIMIRLIPGDPATVLLGDKATPELVAALKHKMGLDKPIYMQYLIFMKNLLTMNMGDSLLFIVPVSDLLKERLVLTGLLAFMAAIFSVLISFPLGYIAGTNKDNVKDTAIRTGTLVALSMPQFWVGLLLLMLFGVELRWLPVAGWGDTWPQHIKSLILPALTQALTTSALLTRNLRNNVVDVLQMDYVDFARSKGLKEKAVRSRHVIRNALITTVTLLSMQMAYMLGGSIIIETVFALPGVGALMVQAIFSRDYAVVQAVVFVFAFFVLLVNLITDISYSFLDPRVRLE